jgi:hypothetical protein
VAGTARLAQGILKVKLSGYTPVAGASFTLIKGGSVTGTFASTDFSEANAGRGVRLEGRLHGDSVILKSLRRRACRRSLKTRAYAAYADNLRQQRRAFNNGKTKSRRRPSPGTATFCGWEDDGDEINRSRSGLDDVRRHGRLDYARHTN